MPARLSNFLYEYVENILLNSNYYNQIANNIKYTK